MRLIPSVGSTGSSSSFGIAYWLLGGNAFLGWLIFEAAYLSAGTLKGFPSRRREAYDAVTHYRQLIAS